MIKIIHRNYKVSETILTLKLYDIFLVLLTKLIQLSRQRIMVNDVDGKSRCLVRARVRTETCVDIHIAYDRYIRQIRIRITYDNENAAYFPPKSWSSMREFPNG